MKDKRKSRVNPFKIRKSNKRPSSSSKGTTKPRDTKRHSRENLAKQALAMLDKIAMLKDIYGDLDDITEQLIELGFTEAIIGGRRVVLTDNFAQKNLAWKSTPMHRYKLEVS